jgi:curved DNA-binding protein CbpA
MKQYKYQINLKKRILAALNRIVAYNMSVEDSLNILGLDESVIGNAEEIKKAYRKAALLNHPDKGGNQEQMKKINIAYKRLLNEKPTSSDRFLNKIIMDLRTNKKLTPEIQNLFFDTYKIKPVDYIPQKELLILSKHQKLIDFANFWKISKLSKALKWLDDLDNKKIEIDADKFYFTVSYAFRHIEKDEPATFKKIVDEIIKKGVKANDFIQISKDIDDFNENPESIKDWDSFKECFNNYKGAPYEGLAEYIYWEDGEWFKKLEDFIINEIKEKTEEDIWDQISGGLNDTDYLVTPISWAKEYFKSKYVVGVNLDELSSMDDDLKEDIMSHFRYQFDLLNPEQKESASFKKLAEFILEEKSILKKG